MAGKDKGKRWRVAGIGNAVVLAWAWLAGGPAHAQSRDPAAGLTLEGLVGMDREALDALYAQAGPGPIPDGRARGRLLARPGSRLARPISNAARVAWQGKVFLPERQMAINRFFGLRMIRANLAYGPSWRDGRPAIILDYAETSRVYARNRDEVREVAPGLYLGLMYARTCPEPSLKLYFAIEARPACVSD